MKDKKNLAKSCNLTPDPTKIWCTQMVFLISECPKQPIWTPFGSQLDQSGSPMGRAVGMPFGPQMMMIWIFWGEETIQRPIKGLYIGFYGHIIILAGSRVPGPRSGAIYKGFYLKFDPIYWPNRTLRARLTPKWWWYHFFKARKRFSASKKCYI